MLDVLATLAFAAFVMAAWRVPEAGLPADVRRRRINVLLAVVVAISFGTGLTQRELWPFSSWPLVAGMLDDQVTHGRIVAVDVAGVEHDVDYRAWQPVSFVELMSWMDAEFPRLGDAAKVRAAAHLVSRAEQARQRAAGGGSPGSSRAFLGPLTAPYFILHPRRWIDPHTAPPRELVGLRYYRETWSLAARARGVTDVRRELVFEFPPR